VFNCPQRCSQPVSGFHKPEASKIAAVRLACEDKGARLVCPRTPCFARNTLASDSASPRAPPAALI
jgi:hypothetical protein